jgi:hypothetical protein
MSMASRSWRRVSCKGPGSGSSRARVSDRSFALLRARARGQRRRRALHPNLELRTFDITEELRAALVKFATRYNEAWLVARHGYRTPAQVRADHRRFPVKAPPISCFVFCLPLPYIVGLR